MSTSTAIVLVGLAAVAVLALSNSRAPPPPPSPQPQPQMTVTPRVEEKQDNTARDWALGIKTGVDVAKAFADALRKWI